MSDYQLGQRVKMEGTAAKIQEWPKTFYADSALPFRENYPSRKTFTEGVIVGSRTVQDGEAWSHDECGRQFSPKHGTARRVWLVAFDLRMKPAMCFDHQVTPIEPTP
jgi:hypothetical protein